MKSKNIKSKDQKESPKKQPQQLLRERPKKEKEKSKEKEKDEENSIEEENIEQIPKPKNIERYIYISTYQDYNLMSNLKQCFEEINQKAFNFPSSKEVYTYNLSPQEQDNNEIDYISGFQLTDKNIRITILEGITGKGMQQVKDLLPKNKLNDNKVKILSNTQVLFDKRIYSKFNLALKLIKLRQNLHKYLETYTLYENANRFRPIYDCFQNLGSLLRVETFEEVDLYNIFPAADSLLLMERKYGDMITHQDMTGIYKEIRKVKKVNYNYLLSDDKNSSSRYSSINISSNFNTNETERRKEKTAKIRENNRYKNKKIYISRSQGDLNKKLMDKKLEEEYQEKLKNIHKLIIKPKTVSRNELYEKFLEEKKNKNVSKSQIWDDNLKYIEELKQKVPKYQKFCMPCKPGQEIIERPKQILFCPTKRNYFDALVKKMREKYLKDKKHFYSYSNYSLKLSFPMIDSGRNEEYIRYIENKKKWRNNQDFERYKQPEREKYYFPKIKNFL